MKLWVSALAVASAWILCGVAAAVEAPPAARAAILKGGCGGCHTIPGVPGAAGQVGPDLGAVGAEAAGRRPGYSAEQYLRESILEPNAFVAPRCPVGACPPGVMLQSFAAALTPVELDAIVAYLAALGTDREPAGTRPAAAAALSLELPVESSGPRFAALPGEAPDGVRVALGKSLFFDTRLSGDRSLACASCHRPELAWSDGRPLARGYPETAYFRNTPTLMNVAFRERLYWDGRIDGGDLPTLVRDHMTEAHFMNVDGRLAAERLKQVPAYVALFERTYAQEPRFGGIIGAVAAYVRTLVSGPSPYDAHRAGDGSALSAGERRGLELFETHCAGCHAGPLFSDDAPHDLGLEPPPDLLDEPLRAVTFRRFFRTLGVPAYQRLRADPGVYALTKREADRGRFRTPSLREVARTAPYMHDGRFATLDAVVAFYDAGGGPGPGRDPELRPLELSAADRAALAAFLSSVSSQPVEVATPDSPPYAVYALPAPGAQRAPRPAPDAAASPAVALEPPPLAPLPPPPEPLDNPTTPEKVALGRLLFFDRRMSGDGSLSCASCHPPSTGWGAPGPLSFGYPGTVHWRNASTVLNVAYYTKLNWDGARKSIEDQNRGAWTGAVAGNLDVTMAEERLVQIPEYVERFGQVFGTVAPRFDDALRAVAAYQRTLVSRGAPFDAHLRGEEPAIGESARRGLELFEGRADCLRCHNGPLVSDQRFYALGVPMHPDFAASPLRQITFRYESWIKGSSERTYRNAAEDYGLYYVTKQETDKGKFRTPSLRDVCYTAPYMHNGALATLADVVTFYDAGGGAAPNKDPGLRPLGLEAGERADLVAFLETLCGERITDEAPELPAYAAGPGVLAMGDQP